MPDKGPSGRLISFEGGEGAGKSTLIEHVRRALQDRGLSVAVSREPGGTWAGERVRNLLLEDAVEPWSAMAEALLHTAARTEHVERWIRPKLAAGQTVLLDRFIDSTRVYQGIVRGLGREPVDRLQVLAFGRLEPNLTLLLDVPANLGLQRAGDANRYERLGLGFHERVRAGFLEIAKGEPARIKVIDAARPVEEVQREALATILQRLRHAEIRHP